MLDSNYLVKNKARRTAFRKELHKYPEVSQHETMTANRILNYLEKYTSAEIVRIAHTGVLAIFDSDEKGVTILLRSDHDALPIQEVNNFEHKSVYDEVSHKCGHDGHTTILLGVAEALTHFPIKRGKAILLFQPSEENGWGANAVMEDAHFKIDEIDFAYALHNLPGFEKNNIVFRHGSFTAHIKSLIIKLNGKTAHAAEPEKGQNPDLAISQLVEYCHQITLNKPAHNNFFLITTVYMELGKKAYGISAGYGEIHLTIRAWDGMTFDNNCEILLQKISEIAEAHSLELETEWLQVFHANRNNTSAVENIKAASAHLGFTSQEMDEPRRWGEDFGLFTQKCAGAMFGLGAGLNTPALHNPDYDFPDEISETGIQLFYQLLKQHLID